MVRAIILFASGGVFTPLRIMLSIILLFPPPLIVPLRSFSSSIALSSSSVYSSFSSISISSHVNWYSSSSIYSVKIGEAKSTLLFYYK